MVDFVFCFFNIKRNFTCAYTIAKNQAQQVFLFGDARWLFGFTIYIGVFGCKNLNPIISQPRK